MVDCFNIFLKIFIKHEAWKKTYEKITKFDARRLLLWLIRTFSMNTQHSYETSFMLQGMTNLIDLNEWGAPHKMNILVTNIKEETGSIFCAKNRVCHISNDNK